MRNEPGGRGTKTRCDWDGSGRWRENHKWDYFLQTMQITDFIAHSLKWQKHACTTIATRAIAVVATRSLGDHEWERRRSAWLWMGGELDHETLGSALCYVWSSQQKCGAWLQVPNLQTASHAFSLWNNFRGASTLHYIMSPDAVATKEPCTRRGSPGAVRTASSSLPPCCGLMKVKEWWSRSGFLGEVLAGC